MLCSRVYNDLKIDLQRGTITKRSRDPKLRDELAYYEGLPEQQRHWFPRLLDAGETGDETWLTLEYYDYPDLGACLEEDLPWECILEDLGQVLSGWATFQPQPGSLDAARKMYLEKTAVEFTRLQETAAPEGPIAQLLSYPEVTLNGTRYRSFPVVWPQIRRYLVQDLLDYPAAFIHGDFCLANILRSRESGVLRTVDPRGAFGSRGCLGDPRYDVAKLYHSCGGGYETLIRDRFDLIRQGDHYTLTQPPVLTRLEQAFAATFKGSHDLRAIKTIAGTIFIGMAARHYDSVARQQAMYLIGVRMLNEVLY